MFEITGNDVAALNDADLRTLVARLSLAELSRGGLPLAGVTAGGNQDAADGGIDVRVEVAGVLPEPDFIPRQTTGFQVKKPDMTPAVITSEMKPKGVLRPVIGELADAGGSYVIISSQGSVADKPLAERKKAMRAALVGHPRAKDLHVDFYDRERIATWVNEYPGVAAWLRVRIGRELSGWRSIGDWTHDTVIDGKPYLYDGTACLIDERFKECENLQLLDGIAKLRAVLGKPRQAVRLIGLSGLGKTRLVQALFETGVGNAPLDAGLAVYTDYAEDTTPSAREMARGLIESNRRAILLVDNCNPEIHAELARICTGHKGNVSLITVEYDVRDDEPERTEVFRLQNASPAVVEEWIEREFEHISQVDRSRIATFSDGNFRVARALAETLRKGETLGQLKNYELFQRIFRQRNEHDHSLQLAAEDLALLYSFDGQDCTTDGELARIGALRGVAPRELFTAAVDLGRRGIVQARGQWRAILPQAIANSLAAHALQRIPDAEFDAFCASLPSRILKSLSRRLGYLHDSPENQRVVKRWLAPGGPLGDLLALGDTGLEIFRNVAPVAPEAVLAKLAAELAGPHGASIVATDYQARWQLIGLVKTLAYEPTMFEDAAMALARFAAAEPTDYSNNSARAPFGELFHLYLSGTRATPQQRRELVRRLSRDHNTDIRRCASLALNALLQSAHFSSTSHHDFGARPRDFGWTPVINGDIYDWFNEAIALALELDGTLSDIRLLLARSIRQLWRYSACEAELERASKVLLHNGTWIDGWLAFRSTLRFDSASMRADSRKRLLAIIDRLKPSDLLTQARAFVLTPNVGGVEIIDGETEDLSTAWTKVADRTTELGETFAIDETLLRTFLPEVFAEPSAMRASAFGKGLATGAEDVAHVWSMLHEVLTEMPKDARNVTVLGGFLSGAAGRDPKFAMGVLDALLDDPILARKLPWLQSQIAIDEPGIQRLMVAIDARKIEAKDLYPLTGGAISDAPALPLADLLVKIVSIPNGSVIAPKILHMYLYCLRHDGKNIEPILIACGRFLLVNADFSKRNGADDFGLKTVVEVCLSGPSGEADTRAVCRRIRKALDGYRLSPYEISYLLEGLFETQPFIALDELVMAGAVSRRKQVFEARFNRPTPIDKIELATLQNWANLDPDRRYPALGSALSLFTTNEAGDETGLSPHFLKVLEYAPDRMAVLKEARNQIQPSGWSGPLHLVLERRHKLLRTLSTHPDAAVRAWVADQEPWLAALITADRDSERKGEQSFE